MALGLVAPIIPGTAASVPSLPAFETPGAKSCSVITYSEAVLYRQPWSTVEQGPVPEHSIPGPLERSLFRALEWMAIDQSVAQGKPFANPLVIHPRDICERLCWRATQHQFRTIERGFRALCRVRVPGPDRLQSFGVLSSATPEAPRTRVLSAHSICPNFSVVFDPRFVESVNARAIIPVNWGLWVALRQPLSRRLLEVLDADWPRSGEAESATFSLEDLSERIPLAPGRTAAARRALFEQAHRDLIAQEYLRSADPLPLHRFRYRPGATFSEMRSCMTAHRDRVLLAGIRSGWSLAAGSGSIRPSRSHNIRRACSSP
jgi:hypothetical protein